MSDDGDESSGSEEEGEGMENGFELLNELTVGLVEQNIEYVIESTRVASGVRHYCLELEHIPEERRVVFLVHRTAESMDTAECEAHMADGYPQRLALTYRALHGPVPSEKGVNPMRTLRAMPVERVWVLMQSPLTSEQTGQRFPRGEHEIRQMGDLYDFLLLHLVPNLNSLRQIKMLTMDCWDHLSRALETPLQKAPGLTQTEKAAFCSAIAQTMRIESVHDESGHTVCFKVVSGGGAGAVFVRLMPNLALAFGPPFSAERSQHSLFDQQPRRRKASNNDAADKEEEDDDDLAYYAGLFFTHIPTDGEKRGVPPSAVKKEEEDGDTPGDSLQQYVEHAFISADLAVMQNATLHPSTCRLFERIMAEVQMARA